MATQGLPDGYTPQSPMYRKVILAMVGAGLASFNALYCTQALLPVLSEDLHVTPATASLTVSATTGMLALSIIPASIISERFGRKRVIMLSALSATLLGLLPLSMSVGMLITLRGLQGIAVAGVPATAMAYLSEEIHPKHVPQVMGLYVAGTSVGGLSGRVIPSGVLEFASWRWALAATVAVAIIFAFITSWALPDQQRFQPKRLTFRSEFSAIAQHVKNPRLSALFTLAFLFMGAFVSLYDYVGYRLTGHFGLSEGVAGAIFFLYLSGTWSATQAGTMIHKFGQARVLVGSIVGMMIGMAVLFFPRAHQQHSWDFAVHGVFLRGPLCGVGLGRSGCHHQPGGSVVNVFLLLLHGVVDRGLAFRPCPPLVGVGWTRRVAARRAGHSDDDCAVHRADHPIDPIDSVTGTRLPLSEPDSSRSGFYPGTAGARLQRGTSFSSGCR